MRILAVDPLAPWGHINFNIDVLKALREIGPVTLATFSGFQKHFSADAAIDIPDEWGLQRFNLAFRLGQPLVLDALLRAARPADYDATVFLSYETISLALKWPRELKAFVFEHNNTDLARPNPLRMRFYKKIPASVVHLVFMDYVGEYITRTTGRRTIHIPLPCRPRPLAPTPGSRPGGQKLILCPSWGTRSRVIRRLKRFVQGAGGRYRLVAKGRWVENSPLCRVERFLEDREALMAECDLMFFGGDYEYRVSVAAHEALSQGKPVATTDCLFGHEFARLFPHSVRPVRDLRQIESMSFDAREVLQERDRLLRENSHETVREALRKALSERD